MPRRCSLPQTDVDAGLLATFEYLQSLGMSSEQMYQCLAADSSYCSPTALPRLSECDAAPGSCAAAQPARLALLACVCIDCKTLPTCSTLLTLSCLSSPLHSLPCCALSDAEAVAAFWLGKGMAKPDLIHMIAAWPKVSAGFARQ